MNERKLERGTRVVLATAEASVDWSVADGAVEALTMNDTATEASSTAVGYIDGTTVGADDGGGSTQVIEPATVG